MEARQRPGPITWALIICYLLMRIGLLGIGRLLFHMQPPAWVEPAYGLGVCAVVAMLIAINADTLSLYNFDRLAFFSIILGYPLNALLRHLQLPFPVLVPVDLSPYYLPVSAVLLVYMLLRRPSLPARFGPRLAWLATGLVAGASVGVISGCAIRATLPAVPAGHATLGQLMLLPVQQFTYAALAEEPVFRGFLWGALRQAGLSDGRVFIIQGVLFWIAHVYYFNSSPPSFWVIVPLGAVLTGLLAWRSRSIATSMLAHGMMNGIGQAVAFYTL